MTNPQQHWRPASHIRVIVLGAILHGPDILVECVRNDQGAIRGWRLPGGGIEFGETSTDALVREFHEEFSQPIEVLNRLCILENIYTHEGVGGHELVVVHRAHFIAAVAYETATIAMNENGQHSLAYWKPLADFQAGRENLFPSGILRYLLK
jgi:ADP-ribose pyrophosphatase YjhB (NUDIX family)